MSTRQYLPSNGFITIVGSVGLAGLLVLTAQYLTRPQTPQYPQLAAQQTEQTQENWQAQLDALTAGIDPLPQAPSEKTVSTLLEGAKSDNITDTVARSLFVSLSAASAEGLGSDIPTQDKILAAAQQAAATTTKKAFNRNDIVIGEDTSATQKAYGNAVMVTLGRYTGATSGAVLLAVSKATDTNNPAELKAISSIQAQYEALAEDLLSLSVPRTLVPLHLQAVNDIAAAASALDDIQKLFTDPLRGLQGLQTYQSTLGETGRVFTSIAEILAKNGILFSKDEPGAAWSVFLSTE